MYLLAAVIGNQTQGIRYRCISSLESPFIERTLTKRVSKQRAKRLSLTVF